MATQLIRDPLDIIIQHGLDPRDNDGLRTEIAALRDLFERNDARRRWRQ